MQSLEPDEAAAPVQDTPDVPNVGDPHAGSPAAPKEAPRPVPQGLLPSGPQGPHGLPDDQPPRGVQLTNIDIRQTIS